MRIYTVQWLDRMALWLSTFLLIGVVSGLAVSAAHATPPPASKASAALVPLPAAAETFSTGTLKVQRFGDHGRVVILIPGLECGPWEWARSIRHLAQNHRVYALTLAGFDGVPAPPDDPAAGSLLDRADASLLQLIRTRHLHRPVLAGHSLGGTLALRFAGEHADLISGVVAVDGLPVFPFMDRMSDQQRQAAAARMRAQMAGMSGKQFRAYALGYMQRMGVLNAGLAAQAAPLLVRSDPKASAEYMAADLAADYRPGLKRAHVPILEISPYNAPDFESAAEQTGRKAISEADKTAYYRSMLANAPDAKVVSISPARHFVMLDQPRKFRQVLDGFLSSLSGEAPHD